MSVTINTEGMGAVMDGTTRDMAPTIKAIRQGWKWSRNLGSWYLPRTLRPETVTAKVSQTVKALEAEGISVTWEDGERADEDERARYRYERDTELVSVHEERAERLAGESEQTWEKSRELADLIPMGQPILVGHHSERRHRRHIAKIQRQASKSVELQNAAKDRERKARSAANRVARADERAELAANGPTYGADDIEPGDLVRCKWPYHKAARVVRVNAKSVSTETGYSWVDRIPYADIVEVVKVVPDERPAPPSKPKTIARNRTKLVDSVRASHTLVTLHRPVMGWEPRQVDPSEAWRRWDRNICDVRLQEMPDGRYRIHTSEAGGMTFMLAEPEHERSDSTGEGEAKEVEQ